MSSSREERGLYIAKHSSISENPDGSFSVPSQNDRAITYTVKVFGEAWTCDCPDFLNRADQIDTCKHAFAVRFWIASKVELQGQPKPKVFSEDATQCAKCGSIRVVKFGNYNGKQLYKCKDCRTKFREDLLKKSKYTPETIALTLDLYFSGLSLRKIARTMNDHFGQSVGATTVYDWIRKFVPMVSDYANSLAPKVSDTWHADELFAKTRGGHVVSARGNGKGIMTVGYLWNVMDRKTRFLLASELTKFRDVGGADRVFRKALDNAHGGLPKTVFTDGWNAYNDPVHFQLPNARHVSRAGVGKPHANNNRVERLNGTLRERVKVQRGWKTLKTVLPQGQRIHYNFVKPHQALEGQTPAQVAGVGVQGNKWLALLRKAVESSKTAN